MGIFLIGSLINLELGVFMYLLATMLMVTDFDFTVFVLFGLSFIRALFYVSMCCDGISRRKTFLYAMCATTIAEILLFTAFNVSVFSDID